MINKVVVDDIEYDVVRKLSFLDGVSSDQKFITWDGSIYEVKEKKWRAGSGLFYWCIGRFDDCTIRATRSEERGSFWDDSRHTQGNYFKTKEEAEAAIARAFPK